MSRPALTRAFAEAFTDEHPSILHGFLVGCIVLAGAFLGGMM